MNYQFYLYLSCVFGLILTAINIAYYSKNKKVSDELAMLSHYENHLAEKVHKKNALLGTRGYQIKKRDEKIEKLEKEIKGLKEELFAFHQITKKKAK
jgi:flagellar biosynthesis chaperone FliJ